MNYDTMPAGPEIDRLVALVMGEDIEVRNEHQWRKNERGEVDKFAMEYESHNGPMCDRCGESYCVHCDNKPRGKCVPAIAGYSTDIIHAWRVLESKALDDADGFRRWYFSTVQTALGYDVSGFHKQDDGSIDMRVNASAKKAPLAICRAVLKAVGALKLPKPECDHRGGEGPDGEIQCMYCNMIVGPRGKWTKRP